MCDDDDSSLEEQYGYNKKKLSSRNGNGILVLCLIDYCIMR